MPDQEDAAAVVDDGNEAEDTPSSEETAAPPAQEAELTFGEQMPEGLAEELDEPDFEEEAEREYEAQQDEEEYEGGYEDPELRKRLLAAEKKAEHYEQLRAREAQKSWRAEATKYFPLAEHSFDKIKATSRRGFLREAKQIHETTYSYLKPHLDKLQEATEKAKETATTEARQDAERAWGRPTTGGSEVPSLTQEQEKRMQRARRTGDFADVVKAMVFPPKG